MVDHITFTHQTIHDRRVADVFDGITEAGFAYQGGNILKAAGGQVIYYRNLIPLYQELFGQMAANKTSAASNQSMDHAIFLPCGINSFPL
jgi:hypothetical protein